MEDEYMKILIVNKFLYRRGGAESYILDLAGELLKQGHEVQFFGMHDQHNEVGNRAMRMTTSTISRPITKEGLASHAGMERFCSSGLTP